MARYLGGPQGPSGGKRPKAQDSNNGKGSGNGSGNGKGEPPALAPNMSDPLWQLMNVSVMVGQVTTSNKRVVVVHTQWGTRDGNLRSHGAF